MLIFNNYRIENPAIWNGRTDSENDQDAFRFHQVVKCIDLRSCEDRNDASNINFCILGFESDEGIMRNKGREGAAEAPRFIRKQLANLPANFYPEANLFDAGNVFVKDDDLEAAQADLANAIEHLLEKGYQPLVLGGGHEIVLGHFNGVDAFFKEKLNENESPLIINLDAHFDLRPFVNVGSSGTMFNQIGTRMHEENRDFNYTCIGIQTYANTKSLYKIADDFGVNYFHSKDIFQTNKTIILDRVLDIIDHHSHIYLTLDFDVLNAANAPGVSAPQPFGMDPEIFLFLVKGIVKTGKVRSLDVAEISPRFDDDNRTSKLAAVTLFTIMNQMLK